MLSSLADTVGTQTEKVNRSAFVMVLTDESKDIDMP